MPLSSVCTYCYRRSFPDIPNLYQCHLNYIRYNIYSAVSKIFVEESVAQHQKNFTPAPSAEGDENFKSGFCCLIRLAFSG